MTKLRLTKEELRQLQNAINLDEIDDIILDEEDCAHQPTFTRAIIDQLRAKLMEV